MCQLCTTNQWLHAEKGKCWINANRSKGEVPRVYWNCHCSLSCTYGMFLPTCYEQIKWPKRVLKIVAFEFTMCLLGRLWGGGMLALNLIFSVWEKLDKIVISYAFALASPHLLSNTDTFPSPCKMTSLINRKQPEVPQIVKFPSFNQLGHPEWVSKNDNFPITSLLPLNSVTILVT